VARPRVGHDAHAPRPPPHARAGELRLADGTLIGVANYAGCAQRSEFAGTAAYGYCAAKSQYVWVKHTMRSLLVLFAAGTALFAIVAPASNAAGVTPDQLIQAGWSCRQPGGDPTRLVSANRGQGLPPLPGTPGFADRQPSYELLVFVFATGDFIGVQKLLRPDVYLHGTPPCPQQPSGEYFHVPGIDLWACLRRT